RASRTDRHKHIEAQHRGRQDKRERHDGFNEELPSQSRVGQPVGDRNADYDEDCRGEASQAQGQNNGFPIHPPLITITSVALISATAVSPTFNPNSSRASRVITAVILCSPTFRLTCARIASRRMADTFPTNLLRPLTSSPSGFFPSHVSRRA